jgi:hypothetical protein
MTLNIGVVQLRLPADPNEVNLAYEEANRRIRYRHHPRGDRC